MHQLHKKLAISMNQTAPNQINQVESRQRGGISNRKGEAVMDRWLEYDLVALAMLVFGIAAVEFLALSF